jgi:hypothetical protein
MTGTTTEIEPLERRHMRGRLDPAMCLKILADADIQKGFVRRQSNCGSAYLCNIEYLVEEGVFEFVGHQPIPGENHALMYTYRLTEKGRILYNGLCGVLAGIIGLPGDDCKKINRF